MVRLVTITSFFDSAQLVEGYALENDTKPTDGIATGSKITEIDTGKTYIFDEAAGSWSEFPPNA